MTPIRPVTPASSSERSMTWQAERGRLRQRPLSPLHIPAGATCICGHPRSSHTAAVFSVRCHVVAAPSVQSDWLKDGKCQCLAFDARCGCGHLLSAHAWGTPPEPWACSTCVCKQFGARCEE